MKGSLRLLALALLSVTTACGGSSSSTPPPPSVVGPQTWQVTAGGSTGQEAIQGLEYYPSSLTIDVGDTVTWTFPAGEPHTVSIPAIGQDPHTLPAPNSPAASQPAGGTTYDGSTYTSSGFVLLGKTYSLTFTKAGTYTVYCLIHQPEMVQTITVQPAGTPYPQTQSTVTAQAQAKLAADLALGEQSIVQFPYPPNGPHVAAGIAPGLTSGAPSAATVMRFLDNDTLSSSSVTVSVGSTVVWTNESNNSPHTVTFAPVGQPFPTLNPFGPPVGGSTYDGSTLVNSGVLMPGQSFSLTFTKAGTYTYHCIFHDDTENMIGTVVVQ
jgi:plastocyanin